MRYLALALWLLGPLSCLVHAQETHGWPVGTRLRLTTADGPVPFVGTLIEVVGDTLFLQTGRGVEGVRRPEIRAVAVSRGYHRYWLEATLVGAGAGAALGFLATQVFDVGSDLTNGDPSRLELAAAGAVMFGLVSGIAGYNVRAERWRPGLYAGPVRLNGTTLAVSVAF